MYVRTYVQLMIRCTNECFVCDIERQSKSDFTRKIHNTGEVPNYRI